MKPRFRRFIVIIFKVIYPSLGTGWQNKFVCVLTASALVISFKSVKGTLYFVEADERDASLAIWSASSLPCIFLWDDAQTNLILLLHSFLNLQILLFMA